MVRKYSPSLKKNVPVVVKDTLLKNNLEQPEINLFVLHQANKYMLNFLRKKMKIEEEKFYYFLSEVETRSRTVFRWRFVRQNEKID